MIAVVAVVAVVVVVVVVAAFEVVVFVSCFSSKSKLHNRSVLLAVLLLHSDDVWICGVQFVSCGF